MSKLWINNQLGGNRLATSSKTKLVLVHACFLVGASLLLLAGFYPEWIDTALWPLARKAALFGGLFLLTVSWIGFLPGKNSSNTPMSNKAKPDTLKDPNNYQDCLEKLKEAEEKLIAQEKMVQVGLLTAGIAHEIKNPLNFVTNFSKMSLELLDELKESVNAHCASASEEDKENLADILSDLTTNTTKVSEHGQRAESIVMNMLAQSRSGDQGEKEWVDLVPLIKEDISLAYHGIRAHDSNFNIKIEKNLDESTGQVKCLSQAIGRVLLNIANNGMYAAHYRSLEDPNHQPVITVSSKGDDKQVFITIRDNGMGIPPESIKNIFQPFFTTKPKGQGTGLGLSICHDIITKQHSGEIKVDSKVGHYTEFTIILPREST